MKNILYWEMLKLNKSYFSNNILYLYKVEYKDISWGRDILKMKMVIFNALVFIALWSLFTTLAHISGNLRRKQNEV